MCKVHDEKNNIVSMTRIKKLTKPQLPNTYFDAQAELEIQCNELREFIKTVDKDISAKIEKHFIESGGCQKCHGSGRVVIWDTLDFMDGSCAEYGKCPVPSCTEETRKHSGQRLVQGRRYELSLGDKLFEEDIFRIVLGPLDEQLKNLETDIREINSLRSSFKKGDRIVVYRGRKVPVGTAGRVAWISSATGSILLKGEDCWEDRSANGTWVNIRNLEKIIEE